MPLYAIRPQGTSYHIVEEREGLTLCGLKVGRLRQKGRVGTLYSVEEKPEGRSLCKNCERLSVENPLPKRITPPAKS